MAFKPLSFSEMIRQMTKLNFGCGSRIAKGWINIDFHPASPEVQQVNLLSRLPFPDNYFDVVYSSHTLEHFSRDVGERILRECFRVMKSGGIIRIVVPDLEKSCREYLRILDAVDHSEEARRQYQWIILELLDQLTRTEPSGLIWSFSRQLRAPEDQRMLEYVASRTATSVPAPADSDSFRNRLRRLSVSKLWDKVVYGYVGAVKRLFPPSLREAIIDNTKIGEKHRWMYDRHGMAELLERCGFGKISLQTAFTSSIPGFAADHLDTEPDGRIYKPQSLYCEGIKT